MQTDVGGLRDICATICNALNNKIKNIKSNVTPINGILKKEGLGEA